MKHIALLLVGLVAHVSSAFALDCAAPLTQKDMNECAYEGFLDASRDYASSYKTLGDGLSAAQKKQLLRMQKSWMAYRTQACGFESSASQGGSVQAMVKWQCMARMTKQRAGELDMLSRCPEGDVSCVQPTVKVYKASGSTQCNPGSGTPVKVMLDQFAARMSLCVRQFAAHRMAQFVSLKYPPVTSTRQRHRGFFCWAHCPKQGKFLVIDAAFIDQL